MDKLNRTTTAPRDGDWEELEAVRLAEVSGGAAWVRDEYCGTPFPPRPLALQDLRVAQIAVFGQKMGG
jgi:hypothetical protein